MDLLHPLLAVLSGVLVGFTLGTIGGGGSILATPLLLYVVGLEPHIAIGTGALAVSVNAFANFGWHARAGHVRWTNSMLFAVVGVIGAVLGSTLGKRVDGQQLLFEFAILMVVVGVLMLRLRCSDARAETFVPSSPATTRFAKLTGTAIAVGGLSGFFGIGGGFLIVPGLVFSTGMPIICAIGSSLLVVGTFGLTTAISYGLSGLIDWTVAAEYLAGGLVGGVLGLLAAVRLAPRKAILTRIFALLAFIVAGYMFYRNAAVLGL